jgi:hypothetical protein
VRDDGRHAPVKEVQHSVVDAGVLGPELVDTVPEIVALWAAQFVAQLFEAVEANPTLRAGD